MFEKPLKEKRVKDKICKYCSKTFTPTQSLQNTCSYAHFVKYQEQKEKEKKKIAKLKKSVSVSVLWVKADKLWSEVIRSVWECEYCGKKDNLNAHHIFWRNNKSVRWEKSNGICLCAGCHTFSSTFSAHKTPSEFTYWLESVRGRNYMDNLQELAHIPTKITSEYLQEQIEYFKKILSEYE